MPYADPGGAPSRADVCLVAEGTYPYARGGVSTWIHHLISGLPSVRFTVAHIGADRGTRGVPRYALPANAHGPVDLFCREPRPDDDPRALRRAARAACRRHAGPRGRSRTLAGLRRLHLEDRADGAMLDDLAAADLPVAAFLHGRPAFDLIVEVCERHAPEVSFLHLFWHFRSMYLPLVRLLAAPPPPAVSYHALCTGYAGILAAVWSRRSGRPLILTEHGIYTRERSLELSRSAWFRGVGGTGTEVMPAGAADDGDAATASALRRMWDRHFRALARSAYAQASRIVALSEAGRARQIADGAPAARTLVIPNGVDIERLQALAVRAARRRLPAPHPACVAFVGRIVPIKDVITFIRACDLALRKVGLDVRIIGPLDEDPAYADRCRRLVVDLGRTRAIRFEGQQPMERIYSTIDVLVLTSLSEGQPLVILEANAAGIPVIATDVGACRELIEGRGAADRALGPGGVVTRLAAPEETAAAIVSLARDRDLRRRMGLAASRRAASFYRHRDCLAAYESLYSDGPWPESAGASIA